MVMLAENLAEFWRGDWSLEADDGLHVESALFTFFKLHSGEGGSTVLGGEEVVLE